MNLKRVIASYKPVKNLFVFLLVLCFISCKQNSTSNKLQASSENWEIKAEIKTDSLDLKIERMMARYNVPGLNLALIENGKLSETRSYGVLQKGSSELVNDSTLFSMGSVSKVVNAFLTLQLVKAEKLDLDEDVNTYLGSWKVEQNRFSRDTPVTLRHILSHTAGFSVHGFADYYPGEAIPNTFQILTGTGPAKNNEIKLIFPVGSTFKYSGGGITVAQKIIEDLTGLPYHEAASQLLFAPLELKRMTFENPLPAEYGNIAKAHNQQGNPVALPRGYQAMPEKAASGLWASAQDFSKLMCHVIAAAHDEHSEFLSPELVADMITKEKNSEFGLGPYIDKTYKDKIIVTHNGANDSYKSKFAIFWKERKGYVVFTNGQNGTELINDLKPILNTHLKL